MPRDKKTPPIEAPIDGLPDLSAREYRLIQALEAGESQSRAYEIAYGRGRYSDASLWVRASRKCNEPKIRAWLNSLKCYTFAKAARSREERIRRLERLAHVCETTGNLGAAVQAEVKAGQLEGHYVEQHADVTERISPEMLVDWARQTFGEDAARRAAEQLGVTIDTRH